MLLYKISDSNDAMINALASQARGPRFESRWEHSSFSLKSPDFKMSDMYLHVVLFNINIDKSKVPTSRASDKCSPFG